MLQNKLRIRGYSSKTIKAYLGHIRRYLKHYENELNPFRKDLVEAYLLNLIEEKNSSHSYINQTVSAIKFALKNIINTDIDVVINRLKKKESYLKYLVKLKLSKY